MTNTLFQNILPEDIPVMLKRLNAYTKSYQKEEYIKHAGDPADFIGIIESGSVHILQDDYYGNRNITASIPPNSLFGEAFACAGIPYLPVDIVAAEDCTVMFLRENTVKHLRQQLHFPSYPDTQSPRNRSAEKYVSESEDQIYLP